MYRHIYGFKFKDETTEQQIDDCVAAFNKMKAELPWIISATMGPNANTRSARKFYPWLFTTDFANVEDYSSYEESPQHAAFIRDHLAHIVERRSGPMDLVIED